MTPDDYPAAAGKHVEDAGVLLRNRRFDGAGYLAGYAVECVLKTLIEVEGRHVRWTHDLNRLSTDAWQFASLPSQRTARYVKSPAITTLRYDDLPGGWKETLRYTAPRTISETLATEWFQEARRLHAEVIVPMKLDGVIP